MGFDGVIVGLIAWGCYSKTCLLNTKERVSLEGKAQQFHQQFHPTCWNATLTFMRGFAWLKKQTTKTPQKPGETRLNKTTCAPKGDEALNK